MPSYLTLHIDFDRADSPGLVRRVYGALAEFGAPSRGGVATPTCPWTRSSPGIRPSEAEVDDAGPTGWRQEPVPGGRWVSRP